ncbi:uncharacterized protein FFB14_04877 [Fusarium fujikuroi]|nr:uncharacterized protein FFB14_04877 [Fusarium fujikuroi]
MGKSLRLQPPLSHINNETVSWMKSKLESCVLHDHINPNKRFIPDRLIDVRGGQLSLVLNKDFEPRQDTEAPRYVALTYCWGPEPLASRQLKTTRANIAQHQQQIPQLSLPQVIKDAVTVARELSIPFLWVDALCILQDDVSDWDKQCAVMERIYGNAHVVVAAASSHNCEEGFIKRKDRILLPFRTQSDDTHAIGIYSPLYKADESEDLVFCPWLKRGWTFQERIASTRLLMFSKRNVHFKCKSFTESMGRERNNYDTDFLMLNRMAIESGNKAHVYKEWTETISQVNPGHHQFTRETDLLPSIAGIAALFSHNLKDEYAAGLWKNNMHQSLCWATSISEKPSYQDLLRSLQAPCPYIAPSWSWASQREFFSSDLYHSTLLADCRSEAFRQFDPSRDTVRFDERYFAHINPDCSSGDIFESSETRTLTAPISLLLIGSTIRCCTDENFFSLRLSDNSETLGGDADGESGYESSSCSSASAESGGNLETEAIFKRAAYGLLIHPTGNPDEYFRVRTFFSKPYVAGGLSFFDDTEVRTVKLVYGFLTTTALSI